MGVDYDVIVVGAGPAGCAAAITLARNGVDVVLLEKTQVPGQRNVTGGVLYAEYIKGYSFADAFPTFENEAPLERRMVSHEVYIVSEPKEKDGKTSYRFVKLDEHSLAAKLGISGLQETSGLSYSVLRAKLDKWMAEKVREAGGVVSTCTTVEGLIIENGEVRGVRTDRDEIKANVVIDCGGVTSKLVEAVGLRGRLEPKDLYHGVKHVYKLSAEKIEERFGLKEGEGKAIFYMGKFMKGVYGGAFVYTNKETLSVGIVVSLDSFLKESLNRPDEVGKPLDILEEFENHPAVTGLLEDAELVEYSAHNIPKGHKAILKKPYRAGFLVAGDALGAFVKIGSLIDGMRRAVASGIMAAETYLRASEKGRFSEEELSYYAKLLEPVYRDVSRAARNAALTEGALAYKVAPTLLLKVASNEAIAEKRAYSERVLDVIQRVQSRTGLLDYDEDKEYSHIKVNYERASASSTKPWVAACPVNCYTLVLDKGIFASYKDLYLYNLTIYRNSGMDEGRAKEAAKRETLKDIARAQLRFDHVACIACGTCGAIGPPEMVVFNHERAGHGVKFKYG